MEDKETLALGLWSPRVFDVASGQVTVEALKLDYFMAPKSGHVDECGESTGLSAARVDHEPGRAELYAVLKQICGAPPRSIEGNALTSAAEVRAIFVEGGKPAFEVLDDGRENFTAHVVIRSVTGLSKGALRDPRDRLRELLNKRIKRDAFLDLMSEVPKPAETASEQAA